MPTSLTHIHHFTCPQCGASPDFSPQDEQFHCSYCGWVGFIPKNLDKVEEHDYNAYVKHLNHSLVPHAQQKPAVECHQCGAVNQFELFEVTRHCTFCGTAIVLPLEAAEQTSAVEGILPFAITQAEAWTSLKQWLKQNWLAPIGWQHNLRQESVQGVYLPFWTYDASTDSDYTGAQGTYYYTRNAKGHRVRRTRWRNTSGQVRRDFDDILVPATQALEPQILHNLEPWPLKAKLKAYNPAYLAGFTVNKTEVDFVQGFSLAGQVMAEVIRRDVKQAIGGDRQRVREISTSYRWASFKHILLPVWMIAYQHRQKRYPVVVNAVTAEVLGKRPYSPIKIAAVILVVLAVLAIFVRKEWRYTVMTWLHEPEQAIEPFSSAPVPASQLTHYQLGLSLASDAVELGKLAQTKADWWAAQQKWQQAIAVLKKVPPTSPHFMTAQQKLKDYDQNLTVVRKKVASFPVNPPKSPPKPSLPQ